MNDDYGSDNDQYFEDDLYREQADQQLEPWVLTEAPGFAGSAADAAAQQHQQGHVPDADELYKDHISHMFDVPSKLFHPPDVEMDYGDAAVQPSDVTGADEQLMQFPESRMRTFSLLGATLDEKIANTIPSPRRGVRISPDNLLRAMNSDGVQLTILDARSQEEFESLAIVGSHNLVRYWDVEHVINVLWRQMGLAMVPRFPNMPIVVVGERSTLRSPGLYRTISMLSQLMYFFKNHVTLDYPEIYILEGGMQALTANDRYRSILRGTRLLSQFSVDVNITRFVLEKLSYYESWETPRVHDSHLPVKSIRNPLKPSTAMFQTFARYSEEVDPFVKAAQRQRLNAMIQ